MERRNIRPRIRVDGRGSAVTMNLALELRPHLERPGDLVVICGGPGMGKTTALGMAAQTGVPGLSAIDTPTAPELDRAMRTGPVLAILPAPDSRSSLHLVMAPWGDDELIEYCLLNHRDHCDSIIRRVLAMTDRYRIEGVPGLWASFLDHMAGDDSLSTVDGLLGALIRPVAQGLGSPALEAAAHQIAQGKVPRQLSEAALQLVRFRPVLLMLQSQYIIHQLERDKRKDVLDQMLPVAVRAATAELLKGSPRTQQTLRAAAAGRKKAFHPAAISLLVAAHTTWKPSGRVPLLRGAALDGVCWANVSLRGVQAMSASLQGGVLNSADLFKADFSDAILSDASLISARLQDANLSGAQLRGTDLSNSVCMCTVALKGRCTDQPRVRDPFLAHLESPPARPPSTKDPVGQVSGMSSVIAGTA